MSRLILALIPALLLLPAMIGCSDDIDQQVQNLQSPNPMVRLETARLAKRQDEPRLAAALAPLLSDPSREIRLTAATSLTYMGTTHEVPALAAALQDENREVRLAAVNALGRIQDERAVGPLLKLLARVLNSLHCPDSSDSASSGVMQTLYPVSSARLLTV